MAEIPVQELKNAARELRALLDKVHFVEGTPYYDEVQKNLAHCRQLLDSKVSFELENELETPLIAILIGGTNVGKSTVFNILAQEEVAKPDETAAATRFPAVYMSKKRESLLKQSSFLPTFSKRKLEEREVLNRDSSEVAAFYHLHQNAGLDFLLLIDSPDVDSTVKKNAVVGESLLRICDVVVFVKTDQKYLDMVPLEFMQKAIDWNKEIAVVLNKMEDRDAFNTVWEDLQRVVKEKWDRELPPESGYPFFFAYNRKKLNPGKIPPELEPLFEKVLTDKNLQERKRKVLAGTFSHLITAGEQVVKRYQEEIQSLEKVRTRIEGILEQKRQEFIGYVANLSQTQFYELEEAVIAVLSSYRIPGLDDLMDRARIIFAGVVGSLSKGGRGVDKALVEKRKEDTYEEILRLISDAGREVNEYLRTEKQTSPLVAQIYQDLRGFSEVDSAKIRDEFQGAYLDVEKFASEIEDHMRQWMKENPSKEMGVKAFQYSVRIGAGILLAFITNGFDLMDVIIGPLGIMATRPFSQHLAPPNLFHHFRGELDEKHSRLFDELLREGYIAPMEKSLPLAGEAESALSQLHECLEKLKKINT